MDQYIGRLLDNRYEILEIIGTGGMAVVYKARCHRLNRLVAIKILKDELSRDEEFRRRFHAEGEAVAMLSNPNIVQVYDVSSSNHANYIVMELIDGISLKQYMEKKGVLNWKETLHFGMQIAKALEHAHSRGIVHRDIKPHNVMVLKNGSVKVMDFGIARVMSKSNTLTKEALGSVHYISPEQAKGGWVDNRSDLYSLSVVMYEMMAGRPPYDGESPVAIAIQHINGGAPMPSALNPNIPAGLEQIIMKGMALDTKDRYSSATEMLWDMEEFRKNPAILFAAVKPRVSGDTQAVDLSGIAAAGRQPRTTAEKVAGRKTGETGRPRGGAGAAAAGAMRQRSANRNRPASDSGHRAAQRRRAQEEEEKRSRITTIAIVSCCAVAVVAIVILLIAIMNGGFSSGQPELVKVPKLIGRAYESLPNYENFQIELDVPRYDETIPKGQVIEQNPAPDVNVVKGTVIRVVVSLGRDRDTMEDLVGLNYEHARTFLEGQGYHVLLDSEPSDEYDEGDVIRTDPGKDAQLEEGQTIRIWYSSGPLVKEVKMPNVVGMNYATAYQHLRDMGFTNVEAVPVASDAVKDEVIFQSVYRDTMVPVDTKIILQISKGPQEPTEDPTEDSTSDPTDDASDPTDDTSDPTEDSGETTEPTEPETITVRRTIPLPNREEAYVLSLYYQGREIMESTTIMPGETGITVELTGSGTQTYELYINGEFYQSFEVEFKVDG